MPRERLEVQDIFRACGPAWRRRQAGHLSLGQLKVMAAIERCRTAALGGHVAACEDCGHIHVAYNSCRNRHCPKCQGAAARDWLAARQAELLPVPYFHVVFTLPAPIADIAYQNKASVYGILFKAASETLLTIAADPKHLGRHDRHHRGASHLGLGDDTPPPCPLHRPRRRHRTRRVTMDRLPPRLLPAGAGALAAVPTPVPGQARRRPPRRPPPVLRRARRLVEHDAFAAYLAPLRKTEWVVYAKRPFAGPEAVLAYLARYTHRVAISNSRLIAFDGHSVTFKWKDYRAKGRRPPKAHDPRRPRSSSAASCSTSCQRASTASDTMGSLANGGRAENLARARKLLNVEAPPDQPLTEPHHPAQHTTQPCPNCGVPMIVIDTFAPGQHPHRPRPRAPPTAEAQAA